jgi:predicted enzyme related to lactoylglutathione lyase
MSGEVLPRGLTLQIPVGDIEAGRRFYTALFGRGPDFAPHHDFLEWRVLAGVELWWQVVGMTEAFQPLATRVRLLVDDVRVAARHVETALGVPASAVTTLPSVVKFINFEDPWGNRLGYYQDIVPSDEQPEPGGSVHDERLYETDSEDDLAHRPARRGGIPPS